MAQMRCIQTSGPEDSGTGALWGPKTRGKAQGCGRATQQNMEAGQSFGLGLMAHVTCIMQVFFSCSSGLAKTKQKK